MYLKVIACEIAFRELCRVASESPSLIDFEFLTQGHHDTPAAGRKDIQTRIDAVPAGKYDAIALGYGLCSHIITGLTTRHTPLVIPRAHDCITFFLGSKDRYEEHFNTHPGTYYYTSGWLECLRRRNLEADSATNMFLPANSQASTSAAYEQWVKKYGEDQAKYLLEVMGEWTANYTHGTLINFDFLQGLDLRRQVKRICSDRNWQYSEANGDLGLLRRLVGGQWDENEVQIVKPGEMVVPVFDGRIISVQQATGQGITSPE
jgi:hypothetical protein